MRKTKILATIGPASDSVEIIEKLMIAGMNGVRINFSHGTYEQHEETIKKVKQVRKKLKLPIPLILDTRGPEIRIKTFGEEKVFLEKGDKFILTTNEIIGDKTRVSVTYSDFPKDLKKGDRVLLDDGLIELHVQHLTATDIECVVQNGGYLSSRKGINVPDVYVNLPSLTEKDVEDIKFGIKAGFDYIAASFVRSANDVFAIRHVLEENDGEYMEIIAKIENRDGVNNIDEILEIANGIMVARGDLGVEIPPEEVPIIQKLLINKANRKGKPVITATQMLESMVSNPRPTRAEANDVANAIFDGSDTIMLSGETAAGEYPVESVLMMSKIARKAEQAIDYKDRMSKQKQELEPTITNALSHAACQSAAELEAACIATVTESGFTARMISKFRPDCPIVACTRDQEAWKKLNLVWGCIPILIENFKPDDDIVKLTSAISLELGVVKQGDTMVIAAGLPIGSAGSTNTLRVEIVGNIFAKGKGIGTKAVTGKTCVVKAPAEAEKRFERGDILVCPLTNNDFLPYMRKASAIIVGNPTVTDFSHAEITAAALDIPVIICRDRVVELVPNKFNVTVDPVAGVVLNGALETPNVVEEKPEPKNKHNGK